MDHNKSKAPRGKQSSRSKKQVTINLDQEIIDYFKKESEEANLPYQTLINLYLLDCVHKNKKPNITWETKKD